MQQKNLIIIIIVAIIALAIGAFGGMKYQQSQRSSFGQAGQNGFRQRGINSQNGQAVRGEVVSIDDKTLTVKMRDGSTKLVILSSGSNITKAAQGSRDDIKSGGQVMVFGTSNSDGSVTAQSVQLNPMFGRDQASQSAK